VHENSRENITLLFAPINDDCIADFVCTFLTHFTGIMAHSELSLDVILRQSFAPFHETQILTGTVIGLKNNLPNLASAYETQRRVASTDGIFRSMY
jgi:hypothetical protein